MSAALGPANKGTDYMLHRQPPRGFKHRLSERSAPRYSFEVPERDEAGLRSLAELKERGVNIAATALAQSVDHVLSFLSSLRTELAFYLGCLNLKHVLATKGEPTCDPAEAVGRGRPGSCEQVGGRRAVMTSPPEPASFARTRSSTHGATYRRVPKRSRSAASTMRTAPMTRRSECP